MPWRTPLDVRWVPTSPRDTPYDNLYYGYPMRFTMGSHMGRAMEYQVYPMQYFMRAFVPWDTPSNHSGLTVSIGPHAISHEIFQQVPQGASRWRDSPLGHPTGCSGVFHDISHRIFSLYGVAHWVLHRRSWDTPSEPHGVCHWSVYPTRGFHGIGRGMMGKYMENIRWDIS